MNPFKKFKNYVIGEALAQTDDVFEKARIELTFSFTLFFWLLGILFYVNIIANHLWWQLYITSFGVITLPLILLTLKRTKNVRYAGYLFVLFMFVLSSLNQWLYKFELNIIGGFWIMVFLLFVFFVLDRKWGFIIVGYHVVSIIIVPINKALGNSLLNYSIPPEQVPEQLSVFVLVPFAICIYGIYQIINTRAAAEEQINSQKKQLESNNKELEAHKKDIISSINYAKLIQQAILPLEENIQREIPLSFILYKPRDIVSGDFYWFHEIDSNNYIMVVADCTGHGVPGAFMTVVGSNLLTQIVVENKITKPSDILSELDKRIIATLKQEKEHYRIIQDGMDLSLLKVNKLAKEFIYASAKRPAIFIRNGQIEEFKGSKNALGGLKGGEKIFDEIKLNFEDGNTIYLFTDGYIDQFGGTDNKKFMISRLRELLLTIQHLPMPEQKKVVESTINKWIGQYEQTDDILIMGIRF